MKLIKGKSHKLILSRLNNYTNSYNVKKKSLIYITYIGNSYKFKDIIFNIKNLKILFNDILNMNLCVITYIDDNIINLRIKKNIHILKKCNGIIKRVKIGLPGKNSKNGNLNGEIWARKVLTNENEIFSIPKVFNYDKKRYYWIEMEQIDNSKGAHHDAIQKVLKATFKTIYKPYLLFKTPLNTFKNFKVSEKSVNLKLILNYINKYKIPLNKYTHSL